VLSKEDVLVHLDTQYKFQENLLVLYLQRLVHGYGITTTNLTLYAGTITFYIAC